MVTFLFWNVNRRPLEGLIAALADSHHADVLILAECEIPTQVLLERLNRGGRAEFHFPPSLCEKIKIFTRFSREFLEPASESDRVSIRRLALPARTEILLAAVHLPSKMNWSGESQTFECTHLANAISQEESKVGHSRTLLVGDLNMDPFEIGVVAAGGLHGVMTRRVAGRGSRTVQTREYPFFYNPMWGLFGDGSPGPPGTYYYAQAEHVSYFWHILDQVLLRPDLMNCFSNEQLQILAEAGDVPLLTAEGRINVRDASDHLPLLFKLDL